MEPNSGPYMGKEVMKDTEMEQVERGRRNSREWYVSKAKRREYTKISTWLRSLIVSG